MKHNLVALSFAKIGRSGQIVTLWRDEQGLDYQQACSEGRRRAEEVVRLMEQSDNPTLLGHVVQSIVANRQSLTGLEIGFFGRIAMLAVSGVAQIELAVAPTQESVRTHLSLAVDNS